MILSHHARLGEHGPLFLLCRVLDRCCVWMVGEPLPPSGSRAKGHLGLDLTVTKHNDGSFDWQAFGFNLNWGQFFSS